MKKQNSFYGFFLIILYLTLLLSPCPQKSYAQQLLWDDPHIMEKTDVRFPQVAANGSTVVIAWQEFTTHEIFLSLKWTDNMKDWTTRYHFAGPFAYSGKEVPVFSLQVDAWGHIFVAAAAEEKQTTLFFSRDNGKTFQKKALPSDMTTVSPKLFLNKKGNLLLFVSHDARDALSLYYTELDPARLEDAGFTVLFEPFVMEQPLVMTFLPHYTTFNQKEYVVYQSQDTGKNETFQLYLKTSNELGHFTVGSAPVKLTAWAEERDGKLINAEYFDNQRPFLYALKDRLILVWERSYRSGPSQIYYLELDEKGNFFPSGENTQQEPGQVPYARVTDNSYNCFFPSVFAFKNNIYTVWFDNRRGENHIIMAQKDGYFWREQDISRNLPGNSVYAWETQLAGYLSLFWENQYQGSSRLVALAPDQSIDAPRVYAADFTPDRPYNNQKVLVRWTIPVDPSGIAGYSYTWSQNPQVKPDKRLMLRPDEQSISLQATWDGEWYFLIMAMDNAENWSVPAGIRYLKDTTPPVQVLITQPLTNEQGYLPDNNPDINWKPGNEIAESDPTETLAGYSYLLKWLSADPDAPLPLPGSIATPPVRVITQNNHKAYTNLENGLYAFEVTAIDLAGNSSPVAKTFLRMNQFIAYTAISFVQAETDTTGKPELRIYGRGYTADGTIRTIILDRDKKSPYDYVFELKKNAYKILDDKTILGPELSEYEEGSYYVGLEHEQRGLYFGPQVLTLQAYGTVKLGDYTATRLPPWEKGRSYLYIFTADTALFLCTILFLSIFMFVAFRRLIEVVRETHILKDEASAIVSGLASGTCTFRQKEEKMKEIKTKGAGLRVKFTLLITSLVILVVLIVSVPLSINMLATQQRNLATGLWQRAQVLLGSISAGSEEFLLNQDTLSLSLLTNQISAMPEAHFAIISSITPYGSSNPGKDSEYVWGVNNEEFLSGRITDEYIPGRSRLKDQVSPGVPELGRKVNDKAAAEVNDLVQQLTQLNKELVPYLGKSDTRSQVKVEELGKATASLQQSINFKLRTIASEQINSAPAFDVSMLQKEYVFYMPIVYRGEGQDIYYRGLVRLGVSAAGILEEIASSRISLMITIGIIAVFATILGTIGALLLAFITISPIKKLVAGVARIRDTDDKEELKDHIINIKQRDEIRMLADTINQMTQGLVKAAAANKELTVGKEVQKMFIPLEKDERGQKGTTGGEQTDKVDIFGYYEGAKGVSGDYFDYKKLDEKHYAIIKCDIAGKGVPASLIMVEVATLFLSYFRDWTIKEPGLKINKLVYTINDMLEERGFKGRFAALTICILNAASGEIYFCNAGDNLVHIYKNKTRQMVEEHLPKAPAAGVFPSFMVESQGGFVQVKKILEPGDTLFLFTDGIEESQHLFRDENYKPITCDEPGLQAGENHGDTHVKGSTFEELGIPRINKIVNAVFNRQTYTLSKYHDPGADTGKPLFFDFTNCKGSTRDAVLALAAVEKIFRIYKKPNVTAQDVIMIDKHVDAFLKETFSLYPLYFTHQVEKKGDTAYTHYTYLQEDSQYDDLTILSIKKE